MRHSETILLVEDDTSILRMLSELLEQEGYSVLVARSGEQALDMASDHAMDIDLLVTDMMMPGMDGPKLAACLRLSRDELPVLFISGYAYDTVGENSLQEDGAHFLQKPFTLKQLSKVIRQILDETPLG